MSKASVSDTRKKIGRPKVGSIPIMLRLPPDLAADLDRYSRDMAALGLQHGSRPEAIRWILELEFDRRRRKWVREDERAAKPKQARSK